MTYDPAKFFVWQAPGKQFAIHLSLKVIDKLNQARAEFEGDISAVLLGYSMISPDRATFVDDFVLLPENWDLSGGTYSPKLEETRAEIVRKLAEGAENGQHAIGFCRWQLEGPLELNGLDFAAAQRFFAEADNILLLVRSLPYQIGEAALFYWDDGKLQVPEASQHFPFETGKLSSAPPPREAVTNKKRIQTEPLPPIPPPPPETRSWSERSGEPIRWMRLLPLAAIVTIAIAAAQLAFDRTHPTAPPDPPASAAPASTAPVSIVPTALEEPALGLTVASRPKQLQIRWNHQAKPVLEATKGVMRITDGDATQVIDFSPQQLLDGAVAYAPSTKDVFIRFEVSGPAGHTNESIRAVATP